MAATTSIAEALLLLHYLAPVLSAVYFLAAKTVAVCLLQRPSNRTGSKLWRYLALALQAAVVLITGGEIVAAIVRAVDQPSWAASHDYVFYMAVSAMVYLSLFVGIAENPNPLWHPYLGAWLVAFLLDVGILTIHGIQTPDNHYGRARMALCILRATCLLTLSLLASWRVISGRRKGVRLDAESEALLANNANGYVNGTATKTSASPADSVLRADGTVVTGNSYGHDNDDDDNNDDDDDDDADSFTDEPDRDKELKAQQKKRLQEAGSWLSYLKEFKIFLPMLFPWNDRVVQGCLVVIGLDTIAARALNLLVPRQMGVITNELTRAAGTGVMPWRAVGLYLLYASLASSAGLPLLSNIAQIPVDQYSHKAIATTAFRHIMGLSMDFHNDKNSGELIRAIDQGQQLQDLINFGLFTILPMFFDLLVAFVYVTWMFDIYMGMILFGVGCTYVWIGAKTTAWSVKQRREFNNAWRNESKVQNEAINNWQTVSHFNRAEYESERYTDSVVKFNLAEWRYIVTYYIGNSAQSVILLIGRLAALSIAAWHVVQGRADIGSFITLVQYWRSVESPLASVAYSVRKVSQMMTDSERLLQLLTTQPSITDAPDAAKLEIKDGEVRFENVHFAYDVRKPTLKNVDFTVEPGQTVALVGETGGGKSTILKLLYRYYDVTEGAIRIDGQDIREVTQDSLRDMFGMVPQDPSLFNISIMDNIKYARLDATDEEVKDACRAAAIHDKIESFPDKYNAKVGERGVKLSGGELQRVSIARAILRQPKIVLLDEATSMIDAETEAVIQDAFKRLTAQRTTFVVAHRLSTIQHADLILVIHDGQIVERGTHDELFRQKGKYVALWSKQLSKEVKEISDKLEAVNAEPPLIQLEGEGEGEGEGVNQDSSSRSENASG